MLILKMLIMIMIRCTPLVLYYKNDLNYVQILFKRGLTFTPNWYIVHTSTHTIKLSHLAALFRIQPVLPHNSQ